MATWTSFSALIFIALGQIALRKRGLEKRAGPKPLLWL
jgi:hypothetical protein